MRIMIKAVYPGNLTLAEVLLGGFTKMRFRVLKNILKLGEKLDKSSSIKLLKKAEGKIMSFLQDKADENNVAIDIDELSFEMAEDSGIEAEAVVSNIGYKELAIKFLPQLLEKAIEGDCAIAKIAELLDDEKESVIGAVLDEIPDCKKERIVSLLAEKYHNAICDYLTNLAGAKGLELLKVEGIYIECRTAETDMCPALKAEATGKQIFT